MTALNQGGQMSRLTLGLLVLVAALSCAQTTPPPTDSPAPSTQSAATRQAPTPTKQVPAQDGKVVNVEIFVGDFKTHETTCKTDKSVSPTTVFVSGTDVHHCVGGALLNHKDEKAKPEAFKQTLVQLGAGDSITWTANVAFRVVQVRKHEPITRGGPAYPFTEELPTEFTKSVTVGAVLNLDGSVVQQYKVAFEIGEPGNRVDPDLVCSM